MKDFKPVFLGIITLCVLWVVYFYTVKLPQDNRDTLLLKEIKLENCFKDADNKYYADWNYTCRGIGQEDGCLLFNTQIYNFQARLNSDRISCQNLYK